MANLITDDEINPVAMHNRAESASEQFVEKGHHDNQDNEVTNASIKNRNGTAIRDPAFNPYASMAASNPYIVKATHRESFEQNDLQDRRLGMLRNNIEMHLAIPPSVIDNAEDTSSTPTSHPQSSFGNLGGPAYELAESGDNVSEFVSDDIMNLSDYFGRVSIHGLSNSRGNALTPIQVFGRLEDERHRALRARNNPLDYIYNTDMDGLETQRGRQSPYEKLFGERGILGRCTSEVTPKSKETSGLMYRIRKFITDCRELVEKIKLKLRLLRSNTDDSHLYSLQPFDQARFYMNLEYTLTEELNSFLNKEYKAGRVSADSIVKICIARDLQGLPHVAEFRFDFATQRQFILLNLDTVHLKGAGLLHRKKLKTVLDGWKKLAKEMSKKTLCGNDKIIKTQIIEAQKILDLIGAPREAKLALEGLRVATMRTIYEAELRRHANQGARA